MSASSEIDGPGEGWIHPLKAAMMMRISLNSLYTIIRSGLIAAKAQDGLWYVDKEVCDMYEATLSVSEASAMYGVARQTIYNWLDRGALEFIKFDGKARIIHAQRNFRTENRS
jgi:excisionase family DNA binding protein